MVCQFTHRAASVLRALWHAARVFLDGRQGAVDITVGSFDEPSAFRPVAHAGAEGINEAWLETGTLPRHTSDKTESVAKRWHAAGLEVPK